MLVADWLALLAGGLVFGAAIVAAMVLPHRVAPLAALLGLAGLAGGLYEMGVLTGRYDTAPATGAGIVFLIAGIVLGYTIATASVPHLERTGRPIGLEAAAGAQGAAVILLSCADPARYDPRAIAADQNLLRDDAGIELPLSAVPFIFLTEKARYRAVGGMAPGALAVRTLADKVGERLGATPRLPVDVAYCEDPNALASAVASRVAAGALRIAVVILGPPESARLDRVLALVPATAEAGGVTVGIGPSVWSDTRLATRTAERILGHATGAEVATLGVALVCEGSPAAWERRYSAAADAENYFNQRVRMLLLEAGLLDEHVRACWIDWQAPDVTESVRHLAALGCTKILVVPSAIALPTLETTLDLDRAAAMARVPEGVTVLTLTAWGDDDALADAAARSALAALDRMPSDT